MGRSWSLTTDRGRWQAVTVYPWITEEQAEIGAQLREAATRRGVVAPTSRRTPAGRLIATVQDQGWRVHEWMDFGPAPVSPTPSAIGRQIGKTYGVLHSLAIPHVAPIHPYLTSKRPADDWEKLLDRARATGRPWAGALEATLPDLLDLAEITTEVDPDEIILCNANLIPENVRTAHADSVVITEWDFAGSLTPKPELGSALMHWTVLPSINKPAARAFRAGYLEAAGHWPDLRIADFAVAATGWLNWTYNTICEAISPKDEDRRAFVERETTDLLKRPMSRRSFEEMLAAFTTATTD